MQNKLDNCDQEIRELQEEKQELVMKSITSQQEVQEVQRDLELKDVKIESL